MTVTQWNQLLPIVPFVLFQKLCAFSTSRRTVRSWWSQLYRAYGRSAPGMQAPSAVPRHADDSVARGACRRRGRGQRRCRVASGGTYRFQFALRDETDSRPPPHAPSRSARVTSQRPRDAADAHCSGTRDGRQPKQCYAVLRGDEGLCAPSDRLASSQMHLLWTGVVTVIQACRSWPGGVARSVRGHGGCFNAKAPFNANAKVEREV